MSEESKNIPSRAEIDNELINAEKSGNRQDIASTYVSETIKSKELETKKKEKDLINTILLDHLQEMVNELHDTFDQINEKLNELKNSRNRQNRMAQAEKNGDYTTLRQIFVNEYGMKANKVNDMSHDELHDQRIKLDNLEQQNQAVIISEIEELAQQYRARIEKLNEARPDLAETEIKALDRLRFKCATMNLDFDKIYNQTVQNGYTDFQSATNTYEESNLNPTFNKVALNTYQNDASLDEENNHFTDGYSNPTVSSTPLFN